MDKRQIYKETLFSILLRKIKYILFRLLTQKSGSLFTRGKDRISYDHILWGIHEESVTRTIHHYMNLDYKDFLIDVGANIGLISCQSGDGFREIHMFEPNPLCCNILETNTQLSLRPEQINIYRYGLGDSYKESILNVPKDNWGGAFIRDLANSYSDVILASKDGYHNFNNKNYVQVKIQVKDTETELRSLFGTLSQKNLTKGIIKIDVEGYEETVLIGIAKSLPTNMDIIIIFESWDEKFNLINVLNNFKTNCTVKKIQRLVPWKKEWSIHKKIFSFILKPNIYTEIGDLNQNDCSGEVILEINRLA